MKIKGTRESMSTAYFLRTYTLGMNEDQKTVRVYAVASMELQADTDSDRLSTLGMNEDQKAVRVYAVGLV